MGIDRTAIDGALHRAALKREIRTALHGLPAAERRDVLLDLFAEYEEKALPALTLTLSTPLSAPRQPGRTGRPRRTREGAVGRTDKLLTTLRAHPRMPIVDLAEAVYGSRDTGAQDRTRSLLAAQKRMKPSRVKNVGPGLWEVVTQ